MFNVIGNGITDSEFFTTPKSIKKIVMIFPKSEKLSGTPKPTVVSVIMLYQTASRNLISSEYISANAPNKTKMSMETTKIKILLYNAENLFIVNEFLYKFTKKIA
jgi:hypothetical protein